MAKKNAIEKKEVVIEESGGGMTGLWIGLAVLAFFLLVGVLHLSGIARGPEEAMYQGTKGVPVVRWLTGWMHHEESSTSNMTTAQLIEYKDGTVNDLERAKREIRDLETENQKLSDKVSELTEVAKKVESLEKKLKGAEAYGVEPVEATAAAAAPASQPLPVAAGTAALPVTMGASGENYRLVSKIFEKIAPDTAVDILNNLSDDEKVKIMGSMKEATVAQILTAFDPIKSAQLTRMLARK